MVTIRNSEGRELPYTNKVLEVSLLNASKTYYTTGENDIIF